MATEPTFIVRHYDGFDGDWLDITDPLPWEEAKAVWNERTNNGTKNTKYDDIDYYKVFPSDTRMLFEAQS